MIVQLSTLELRWRGGQIYTSTLWGYPSAKIKVEKDNCLRLQFEVKTNDHWVSFLGYHFNLIGWKVWTGKCSLVKGVSKQPLLLLSSILSREKQARHNRHTNTHNLCKFQLIWTIFWKKYISSDLIFWQSFWMVLLQKKSKWRRIGIWDRRLILGLSPV